MPNEFWPNTKQPTTVPNGIGNQIQQNSAANNPDVFCKSQGSGYRLPSVGEITSNHKDKNPGGILEPIAPGHWSQYKDNDISSTRLSNVSGRVMSGSLINEWGNLSNYNNGWIAGNYWATEISLYSVSNFPVSGSTSGYGRYTFDSATAIVNYTTYTNGGVPGTAPNATSRFYVACVRDLVPTPSTPNPSKT